MYLSVFDPVPRDLVYYDDYESPPPDPPEPPADDLEAPPVYDPDFEEDEIPW